MPNYPAESFYRANLAESISATLAPPFLIKVSKLPSLTSGLLTISPNSSNEEIIEYSSISQLDNTISVSKRGINPSSQGLVTASVDYNNPLHQKPHTINDSIRGDVNHLHIIQDYGTLEMTKLDKNGGMRTGLVANGLLATGLNGEEIVVTGGGFAPTGCVIPFAGLIAPSGYLLANGQQVSRTTYSGLFSVIGTTYGVGDGTSTFNLPLLKGRVVVGLDSSQSEFDFLGESGGEKTHTLTVNEMPSHRHRINDSRLSEAYSWGSIGYDTYGHGGYSDTTPTGHPFIENTGGGQPHNNLQPYIVMQYIIKY